IFWISVGRSSRPRRCSNSQEAIASGHEDRAEGEVRGKAIEKRDNLSVRGLKLVDEMIMQLLHRNRNGQVISTIAPMQTSVPPSQGQGNNSTGVIGTPLPIYAFDAPACGGNMFDELDRLRQISELGRLLVHYARLDETAAGAWHDRPMSMDGLESRELVKL